MVSTYWSATCDSGVPQERTGLPSTCTVHAPHSCAPQPNLVPVRPSSSRSTHSSGVSGSRSKLFFLPLMVSEIMRIPDDGTVESDYAYGTARRRASLLGDTVEELGDDLRQPG